jgi:soluble lytic murein transglycosylase-like protein
VGTLKALAAAILLANPASAAGPDPDPAFAAAKEPVIERWNVHIREASKRFAIPEAWIRRVIRAESGGLTELGGRPITSPAGAMGLMQLMPATWTEMRSKYRLGSDPHDPRDNIIAGTAYLRAMYDRFGYPGLFAAYNAGPGRYEEHVAGGKPLPPETVAYLAALSLDPPRRFHEPAAIVGGGELFVQFPGSRTADTHSVFPAAMDPGPYPELFARLGSSAPSR